MLIERHDAAHTDQPGRRLYTQAEFDAAQAEIVKLRAEVDRLRTEAAVFAEWKAEGDELLADESSPVRGLFSLGVWWADRPWRASCGREIRIAVAAERERLALLAESIEDSAGFHSLSADEIRRGRVGA